MSRSALRARWIATPKLPVIVESLITVFELPCRFTPMPGIGAMTPGKSPVTGFRRKPVEVICESVIATSALSAMTMPLLML
ncbi:hypothetical protein D3C83_106110 [compost metagenome]